MKIVKRICLWIIVIVFSKIALKSIFWEVLSDLSNGYQKLPKILVYIVFCAVKDISISNTTKLHRAAKLKFWLIWPIWPNSGQLKQYVVIFVRDLFHYFSTPFLHSIDLLLEFLILLKLFKTVRNSIWSINILWVCSNQRFAFLNPQLLKWRTFV